MRTSRLYHQLCNLFGQSSSWADQRHLQTLIWMVVGVICRAVAFAWCVYQAMLKRASRLVPAGVSVCFLADRGFADTQLMRYLQGRVALAMSGFASNAIHGFIALEKAGNN